MSILVLQIEDRVGLDLQNELMAYNQKRCAQLGFDYLNLSSNPDPNVPPYWWKVFETKKCVQENPNLKAII